MDDDRPCYLYDLIIIIIIFFFNLKFLSYKYSNFWKNEFQLNNVCTNGWTDKWMERQTDILTDKWTDGHMD